MAQALSSTANDLALPIRPDLSRLRLSLRLGVLVSLFLFTVIAIHAQATTATSDNTYVVNGESDTMAYSLGRSIRINGTVKGQGGAIAFGGDVIVQGTVEGDVAAIGGSVIQLDGSRIGGDVFVIGGTYRYENTAIRNPGAATMMYAGYEQELRNMMRDPAGLLTPRWSPAYIGIRILVVLFWFIISVALTAAMPGTISRGIARLQLTSLRVAAIGFLGAVVIGVGVPFSLHYLPSPISVLVGLMALLLIVIAGLFGRVIIYAATGRWLQRKYLPVGKNSESVALLIGTSFWVLLSSLPYIWPLIVAAMLVTSLGLALTARYQVGWKRRQEA